MNRLASLLFLLLIVAACKEKTYEPFTSDAEVNHWIYDQMKLWYYWEDKLPANPDYQLSPDSFFNSLLYTFDAGQRPDGDRFSWIQNNVDELTSSLSGETVTLGLEYRITASATVGRTFGTVLYTLPGSPSDVAGLKRGDIFTQINGTDVTSSNYRTLLSGTGEKKFTVAKYNAASNTFDSIATAAATPVRFQEDPVHFYTVKTIGGKKIAYLVYHQFYPSSNGTSDKKYDKKLESVFEDFRKQQVSELILDLRYNSGGYVSSAIHLASLIARSVTDQNIFAIKEYNPEITRVLKKKYGAGYFEDHFSRKEQNIGSLIDRVYVLTSRRTASASELLINGLTPYMPVKVVGETTLGKNVGSVTLSDDKKRTKWGLQPIVSKSFNSLKMSEYTAGFEPDYPTAEGIWIYPYGDEQDPLLQAAISAITGSPSSTARKAETGPENTGFSEIASSISAKPGYGSMFEELPDITAP